MHKLCLLTVLLLASYTQCSTFAITSVSTCTNQSATGVCTRWEQNGSVTETTSCFPAVTQVYVQEGGRTVLRDMGQVRVGDMVLGHEDGQDTFSEVVGWLHRKPEAEGRYLEVSTETGVFLVSDMHNVALIDGSYIFAKDLLNRRLHNGQTVTSVSNSTAKGIYAPLTSSNNFYVSLGQGQKTLAHCFAHVRNPEFYESFVAAVLGLWEWLPQGDASQQQVHPAAAWMMETFPSLVEQ